MLDYIILVHFKNRNIRLFIQEGFTYVKSTFIIQRENIIIILITRFQIEAELRIATRYNCDVIRDVVSRIKYPDNLKDPIEVTTDFGNTIYTRKVLLCPGAFVELRRLLPDGVIPNMQLITQSVIFAELTKNDVDKMRYEMIDFLFIRTYRRKTMFQGRLNQLNFIVHLIILYVLLRILSINILVWMNSIKVRHHDNYQKFKLI